MHTSCAVLGLVARRVLRIALVFINEVRHRNHRWTLCSSAGERRGESAAIGVLNYLALLISSSLTCASMCLHLPTVFTS